MTHEEVMEQEITEFAELLYNFRENMDIKSIKASIESFLLANHYCKLDPDQSLPMICYDHRHMIYKEIRKYIEEMLKENWVKVLKEIELDKT